MFMSIHASISTFFNQAEIVEDTNGLCGLVKLCVSREIYSSSSLTPFSTLLKIKSVRCVIPCNKFHIQMWER